MTVNITVVFQALNFLIAYFILERFLFRPIVAIIQKRDERARIQSDTLAYQNQSNETLRVHINEQWQQHQRALHSEIPSIEKPAIQPVEVQVQPQPSLDLAQIQSAVAPLKKILYENIVQG